MSLTSGRRTRVFELSNGLEINVDRQIAVTHALRDLPWRPSPGGEVDRRMLERNGDESGLATSIVRYPPGSAFPAHTHSGGEEFLVLDGVFEDEHGQYPAGSYVRNPIGSRHSPKSSLGCTIFVKLCQMNASQNRRVVRDIGTGTGELILHRDEHEHVGIWRTDAPFDVDMAGRELLVVSGSVTVAGQNHDALTWLRHPVGQQVRGTLNPGARVWFKKGHLTP